MGLIPDDPRQQKAVGAIAVSLVVLYFANSLWYSGAMEAVEADEARVESMVSQNRAAQALAIREGQDTEERMVLYERHIAQLEKLIPESTEVPELLETLTLLGREVGVTVDLVRPQAPVPGDFYDEQTIDMRVFGEFHDVGRFLARIASHDRIITASDVQLELFVDPTGSLGYDAPVEVTFRIQTFLVPDPEEGTP